MFITRYMFKVNYQQIPKLKICYICTYSMTDIVEKLYFLSYAYPPKNTEQNNSVCHRNLQGLTRFSEAAGNPNSGLCPIQGTKRRKTQGYQNYTEDPFEDIHIIE